MTALVRADAAPATCASMGTENKRVSAGTSELPNTKVCLFDANVEPDVDPTKSAGAHFQVTLNWWWLI
jgi:hypothetical protein